MAADAPPSRSTPRGITGSLKIPLPRRVKLKPRFIVLLLVALVALAGAMLVLRGIHRREERTASAAIQRDRTAQLGRALPIIETPLRQFATDYSMWDDMVAFMATRDPEWARVNFESGLTNFQLTAVWVVALDGTTIHAAHPTGRSASTVPSLPPELSGPALLRLLTDSPFRNFYFRSGANTYVAQSAPIQPSADSARKTPPQGWLLAARELDPTFLETLSKLAGASVQLTSGASITPATVPRGHVLVMHPLADINGRQIACLSLDYQPWLLTADSNREETVLMLALSLFLIGGTVVCLQIWVLSPFSSITRSLETGNAAHLKPLIQRTTELGHIARLIRIHFAHQKALSETMEDRARLARDLHDGVIQSIYAAGMGVAAAQSMIASDPAAAQTQLASIRNSLNETIREARGFIAGLEAPAFKDELFETAVKSLVESMQWIRSAATTYQINEAAALDLPAAAKAQALQIVREAVSNSLRHGAATELMISLGRSTKGTELVIDDNGCGFDVNARRKGGHGLDNVSERAQSLGGVARISSTRGRGTRVSVRFPPKTSSA